MRKFTLIIATATALVAACGWMLWAATGSVERDLFIPIAPVNLPQGLTLEGPPPKGIELRVRGPAKAVDSIRAQSHLVYTLDLAQFTPGLHRVDLDPQQVELPGRVKIRAYQPATVSLRVAREIHKELPVQINHGGSPAPGFYLAGVESTPPTVEVRGPAKKLAKLTQVRTKPIDVSHAAADVVRPVGLELPPDVVLLDRDTPIVATVRIQTRTVTRRFADIPVEGRGSDYAYTIHPTRISLEVKGPSSILESGRGGEGISAYVDLNGLAPGVYVRRASITLPPEARLVGDVDPELFTVQIGGVNSDNS